jgi:AcrR family transcriptional regulator
MRQRLIESAMIVFAEKGITSSVIQDVIATAQVSQGSFYNYFRTNEDLLQAVAESLSNEIMRMIESVVLEIDDPALRVATAIRAYLHLVRAYPLVAKFLASAGLCLIGDGSVAYDYLPRDVKEAQRRGSFEGSTVNVALDVIAGAGLAAILRVAQGRTSKDYPEQIARSLLRSLGASASAAEQLTATRLPVLTPPEDSLFARTQSRLSTDSGTEGAPTASASSNKRRRTHDA